MHPALQRKVGNPQVSARWSWGDSFWTPDLTVWFFPVCKTEQLREADAFPSACRPALCRGPSAATANP